MANINNTDQAQQEESATIDYFWISVLIFSWMFTLVSFKLVVGLVPSVIWGLLLCLYSVACVISIMIEIKACTCSMHKRDAA